MKQLFITKIKIRLARGTATTLILCAAALAMSALMAQTPTNTQTLKPCEQWFNDLSLIKRQHLAQVFDKALSDSATDKNLRKRLLDSSNCYKTPKAVIQDRINEAYPDDKIEFKQETLIIFYEPEGTPPSPPMKLRDSYANEHCLHIFYLPPEGQSTAAQATFKNNLMCCYEPW
jgi:hypothetical protein